MTEYTFNYYVVERNPFRHINPNYTCIDWSNPGNTIGVSFEGLIAIERV